MHRHLLPVLCLASGLGLVTAGTAPQSQASWAPLGAAAPPAAHGRHVYPLKEERIRIEATTTGEANLIAEAETELALRRFELLDPDGSSCLSIGSRATGGLAFQGFVLEGEESTLQDLADAFPEGTYRLSGTTTDGRPAVGSAELSHVLPQPALLAWPFEGATGVQTHNLIVLWTTSPDAVEYRVTLEQDDSDTMTLVLPAHAPGFRVPDGVLRPETETLVEVSTIGENGNMITDEVVFETR